MKFWYTYVLLSKKDNKHYIGSTDDLRRRKRQHDNGEVTSTSYRRPLEIIYYEAIPDEHRARMREKYFKTNWGRRFLKKQIGFTGQIDPVEQSSQELATQPG